MLIFFRTFFQSGRYEDDLTALQHKVQVPFTVSWHYDDRHIVQVSSPELRKDSVNKVQQKNLIVQKIRRVDRRADNAQNYL